MGRLLLTIAAAAAAAGCIDWGSLYEAEDAGSDRSDAAPAADSPPNPVGCSDGTAEALYITTGLAACAGAWSVPGVVDELEPSCARAAGNQAENSAGEGCNVSDLCAEGWHVCRDAADVAAHGGAEACRSLQPPEPDGTDSFIYVTRQRGGGPEFPTCDREGGGEDSGDDVWGCGTLGLEAVECEPLDRHLAIQEDGGGCGEPFQCGDDPLGEGRNVSKSAPSQGGGVLCCRDGDP